MELNISCVQCLREKEVNRAETITDKGKREEYLQKVEDIMQGKKEISPPEYLDAFCKVFESAYGTLSSYKDLKVKFNRFMLENEDAICRRIQSAEDSLKTAVQAAQAANYIDCIAMSEINEDVLNELLSDFETKELDLEVYQKFRSELKRAKKIAYITDNCGEIVADKLLIRTMKEYAPGIDIRVIVRGCEVGNDATIEDARQTGLDREAEVIGNGTTIAGTCIHLLPEEVKKLLLEADMIISKGQGNYETLSGCGENIYYLFLCKCQLFMKQFRAQYLEPIFCREQDAEREEIGKDED